ncbi:hypothetical protein [Flavobacterium sp.]|uniref:hypothetical protein n=1 Tax=Flavobacterium sp. TaxID=239 RepID=UPI00261D6D89|nr:hypothetical protein [Flavobacterium sp.]
MSGFNLTLIVCCKKISRKSKFFSDLNFNKEVKFCSLINNEFSICKELNIKGGNIYIHDNFFIEYDGEMKNYGYSELFWEEVLVKIDKPQCSINISSMSRNFGSFSVILKHVEQLLLENYHFFLITNNLSDEIVKKFEKTNELLNIEGDYFLISEKIINYFISCEILDFMEY